MNEASDRLQSAEDQEIIDEAINIANIAESKSVTLRILGALAIRIHITNSVDLFSKLGRLGNVNRLFTDADFVAYSKQRHKVRGLFEDQFKFQITSYAILQSKNRIIYSHPDGKFKVDIFFDALNFSHEVRFGNEPKNGRLKLDSPTIPLGDLVLEKLQIHEITEKDIKDLIAVLYEHRIGSDQDREMIDAKHIATTLADDWGFWYDANMNLAKVLTLAAGYQTEGLISSDVLTNVKDKIDQLKQYVDAEPKSKDWNLRNQVGIKKQWWQGVEELSR